MNPLFQTFHRENLPRAWKHLKMESVCVLCRRSEAKRALVNERKWESIVCRGADLLLGTECQCLRLSSTLDFGMPVDPVSMIQTDRWWTSTSCFFLLVPVLFLWKFEQPPSHFFCFSAKLLFSGAMPGRVINLRWINLISSILICTINWDH